VVKNADCSVITQLSLHNVAVRIVHFLVAVAEIRPAAAHGCEDRQKNHTELLHIISLGQLAEIRKPLAQSAAS
jgi:hypothetical protein